MPEFLTNPATRESLLKAVIGVGKLGLFAASAVLANKVYHTAADEFISVTFQEFKRARNA